MEKTDVAASHPELVQQAENLMRLARVEDPNWPMPQSSRLKQN